MSEKKDKWIDAVAKIIKLTQEGKIIWKTAEPHSTPSYETIRISFVTDYKDHVLRLYEKDVKHTGPAIGLAGGYVETETVLEMVDQDGVGIWAFPSTSAIENLMSAVRFQVSRANDFINDILSEE